MHDCMYVYSVFLDKPNTALKINPFKERERSRIEEGKETMLSKKRSWAAVWSYNELVYSMECCERGITVRVVIVWGWRLDLYNPALTSLENVIFPGKEAQPFQRWLSFQPRASP